MPEFKLSLCEVRPREDILLHIFFIALAITLKISRCCREILRDILLTLIFKVLNLSLLLPLVIINHKHVIAKFIRALRAQCLEESLYIDVLELFFVQFLLARGIVLEALQSMFLQAID